MNFLRELQVGVMKWNEILEDGLGMVAVIA